MQSRWLGSTLLVGLLVMMLIGGMVAAQPAPPEPTAQQQTQDAIIQGYFQGTATAQAGRAATATLEAAFNAAQTATAQVNMAQTATLGAAFSAAQTATWQAANPNFNVDHLRVVSVEEFPLLAGPGRTSAYLAPNGERFAHYNGDEMCIYRITGRQERCISLEHDGEIYRPDTERIYWSPNSRYLTTASEDFLRTFRDADILIIDADEGTVANITDDGTDCTNILRPNADCAALNDLLPTWLPSGDALIFMRLSRLEGTWVTTLFRINADGSGLERLGLLPVQNISYAIDVSPDGQRLAFNFDAGDDRRNGLWVSNLDGRRPDQVFRVENRVEIPYQVTFSADSQYLLTADGRMGVISATSAPDESPVRVSAVDGRPAQVVLDTTGMVRGAGWSPYGSALAYIIFEPNERGQAEPAVSGLYVSAGAGQPGRRVLPGIFVPPTSLNSQALVWGANNTILLTEPGQPRLFAVRLGE